MWSAAQLAEAIDVCDRSGVPRPAAAQMACSLAQHDQADDPAMLAALTRGDVGLVAAFVLAGGTLTGKYLDGGTGRATDDDSPVIRRGKQIAERLARLAETWGVTPTDLAFSYALGHARVASVVFGATSAEQVERQRGSPRRARLARPPAARRRGGVGVALRPAEGRWFEPFAAPPDLQVRLACRYAATADGRHDLIPDGCMDLLWIEGRGVVLCGPDTRAWSFELPPGTPVVGVRFRPGAGPGVFHVDAVELRDERVALDDLLGQRLARVLDQRLGDAADPIARLGVLEQLVRQRTAAEPPDDTVELAGLVASDPGYGVDGLAGRHRCVDPPAPSPLRPRDRVRTGVLRPHRPGAALRPPRGAGAAARDRRGRRRIGLRRSGPRRPRTAGRSPG